MTLTVERVSVNKEHRAKTTPLPYTNIDQCTYTHKNICLCKLPFRTYDEHLWCLCSMFFLYFYFSNVGCIFTHTLKSYTTMHYQKGQIQFE